METFVCWMLLLTCSAAAIQRSSGPLFTTQQPRYPTSNLNFDHAHLSASLLAKINSEIQFNPQVEWLLNAFEQEKVLGNIRALGGGGGWVTRHSYSLGAFKAVEWLKHQYENSTRSSDHGGPEDAIQCELDYYLDGVAPNLICKMLWSFDDALDAPDRPGSPAVQDGRSVVLTAHYDSKGSFGSIEAPGVDDNASGCAVLLAIAQLLQKHKTAITKTKQNYSNRSKGLVNSPRRSKNKFQVVFIHFSGTEQGLLGSESISKKIARDITTDLDKSYRQLVLLLINVNMISYRSRYEPRQMGLSHLGCSSEALEFMTRISNIYVPELVVGNTSS